MTTSSAGGCSRGEAHDQVGSGRHDHPRLQLRAEHLRIYPHCRRPDVSMSECQSRMKAEIEQHQRRISTGGRGLREPAGAAQLPWRRTRSRSTTTARRAEPPRRSILYGPATRYSAIMSSARDGLGNAADFSDHPGKLAGAADFRGPGTALVGRGSLSHSKAFRCASGPGKNGRGPAGAASRHAIVPILRREIHRRDRHRKVGAVIERIDDWHRPSNGLNEAWP